MGQLSPTCSSCGFEEVKIRAKIMDLVEKRGKLHNPFTGSAGVLLGTLDEIGTFENKEAETPQHFKIGDRIYCISSLSGIPIYIDKIYDIDYNYGQIRCSGYAILFEATSVFKFDERLNPKYTLAAIDEGGNLYGTYKIAIQHENKRVAIIGRNVFTTIMYSAAIREAIGPEYKVIAIMDKYANGLLSEEEIEKIMYPLIKKVILSI